MRDIVHLPHDLFLIVLAYLPPGTCVVCRAVSRQWHSVFTDSDICLRLLRWNFPRCREMRLIDPDHHHDGTTSWAATTFAHVARRYHHLARAQPRAVETLPTAGPKSGLSFRPVATWNRFLRLDDKTCSFHHPDPVWTYSQEDALLVLPLPVPSPSGHLYHILSPAAPSHPVPVPFDVRHKHIRRVRLAHSVLIFEWAEENPYHQLNDREFVHRHFVTAFDVSPSSATFRSEWKLHFLGLPLNRSDRFLSSHNLTHYAAYLWQPNRSLYNDDPIEQLAVWDITTPSPYRPSSDPTNTARAPRPPLLPLSTTNGLWSLPPSSSQTPPTPPSSPPKEAPVEKGGPVVIRRLSWRELDFYRLRQRTTPQLRELRLDAGARNLYLVEEEHALADGQHSSLTPPVGGHVVRCTGIPVLPSPCPSLLPEHFEELVTGGGGGEGVVHGPAWVHECEGCAGGEREEDGDQRFAPCWRHAAFPELGVSRVVDREAGVVVEARGGVEEEPGRVEGGMWEALMGKGRIAGDERWILGEREGEEGGGVTILRF
ncbi:hypothetical protein QBC39DRAFT_395662 [Podospora conica]|nr:hypothetical protein QBC39DRAFT_395662 [Schizothecium conicum]